MGTIRITFGPDSVEDRRTDKHRWPCMIERIVEYRGDRPNHDSRRCVRRESEFLGALREEAMGRVAWAVSDRVIIRDWREGDQATTRGLSKAQLALLRRAVSSGETYYLRGHESRSAAVLAEIGLVNHDRARAAITLRPGPAIDWLRAHAEPST